MNILARSCLLGLSLFTVPLIGQTTTAAPTPAPHVLIDTVGPDGWRMRFGPTNLGSMLESEQGRGLWEPHVMPMLGLWKNTLGDEAAFLTARNCVLGYGGRIRIGVWVDPEMDRHQLAQVAIVLEGDGRTDLAKLADEVRRLQERLEGEWSEVDLGGAKVEVRTHQGDTITAPIAEGPNLLIAMTSKDGLAGAVAAARSLASAGTGKPPAPNTPAMRFEVDMPALVALAKASESETNWKLPAALGVESLGKTTMNVATAGPHVQVELTQAFANDERGLFAALFPATQSVPGLQRLHPKDSSWKAGRFDLKALYTTIEKALVALEFGTTKEEVRAAFKKELGVHFADDLLAHTTDEVLLFVSPPDDPEELAKTPWAFAVRLTDQAAFQKSLAIALDNAKPALSREETIEHTAGELRRYGNMFGYDLWFAVGQNLFVIAGGHDCEDRLKALLDAQKALGPATEETKDPEFETLRRFLPPGLNGLGRGDIGSIVNIPIGWWLLGLGEFLPRMPSGPADEEDPEQQARIHALLQQHRLDTVRTATGHAEKQWCWRLFW